MSPKLPVGTQKFTLSPMVNLPVPHQVAVGGDVVDHLGQDPAPVDGVGRGEEIAPLRPAPPGQLSSEKMRLTPAWASSKLPMTAQTPTFSPSWVTICSSWTARDAVLGVEHQDARLGHVREALHGGLAGVAGGGHQDADRLAPRRSSAGRRRAAGAASAAPCP